MLNAMRLDSKHIAEKRINPTSRTMGATPPKKHTGRYKKDEMSKGRSCRHKSRCNVCVTKMPLLSPGPLCVLFFFFSVFFFFLVLVHTRTEITAASKIKKKKKKKGWRGDGYIP